MGAEFIAMKSYFEFGDDYPYQNYSKQVLDLAVKVIAPIIADESYINVSHLVIATTCPDSIAPSVGQEVNRKFYPLFKDCHVIDIIQGCAGGITALLIGSQLAVSNNSNVMVVMADAARKACDEQNINHKIFGNGSFACLLRANGSSKGLLYYKSRQYKDLLNVVHVKLGHDADSVLAKGTNVNSNPRKYLGLIMDNSLAIKLLKQAKSFYDEFVSEAKCNPDIIILHQVNPKIITYLKEVFKGQEIQFINISQLAGNCGTASIGIALTHVEGPVQGKKIFICSFGTGGVITAGLWQF